MVIRVSSPGRRKCFWADGSTWAKGFRYVQGTARTGNPGGRSRWAGRGKRMGLWMSRWEFYLYFDQNGRPSQGAGFFKSVLLRIMYGVIKCTHSEGTVRWTSTNVYTWVAITQCGMECFLPPPLAPRKSPHGFLQSIPQAPNEGTPGLTSSLEIRVSGSWSSGK